MYLKSLELQGFKSFPNRTVLNFERGVTVVVGPNGSGKSNISDAMRWVLGELSSKNIRGTKMEDVIFGGTDDRRPMGYAEVSVTFDNSDENHRIDSPYDEISVTRRYSRTGESEYMINRKPVRLKDIYELFLNTGIGREGYSIIGQGRVAEMISRKSEERRNIFEEAAGISKFRYKKQEAERKLAETENNMIRVRDILGELETRVEPLARDAERAKTFLALSEEKKAADVSLWLFDTAKMREELSAAEDAYKLTAHELSIVEEALKELDIQSERLDNEMQRNRLASEALLRRINEATKTLHELDSAYRLAENDLGHREELSRQNADRLTALASLKANAQNEHTRLMTEAKAHEKRLADLHDERLLLLARQQALTEEIRQIETDLEASLLELEKTEHHAVDMSVRIDMLRRNKESGKSKSEGLRKEIESYEADGEKLQEEVKRCEKSTEAFRVRIDEAERNMQSAGEKLAKAKARREELTQETGKRSVERDSLLERAEALRRMEEHFEGYKYSVRFVMQCVEKGRIAGRVYGPLSKLMSVAKEYTTAIEMALGNSIQHIVVEDDRAAKACIAALKEANAGRATFYPLTNMDAPKELEESRMAESLPGFICRADRLVSCDGKFRRLIEGLLNRTVVFDDIDHASDAARKLNFRLKIVTLDGQLLNAGGSYTGGSVKKDSGVLSRSSDIETLSAKAKELTAQIEKDRAELATLESSCREHNDVYRENEQQKELLLTMSRSQFAALDSANAKLEANQSLTEKLREDYRTIAEDDSRSDEEILSLAAKQKQLKEKAEVLRRHRADVEISRHEKNDERDRVAAEANDMSVRIAETAKDKEAALSGAATVLDQIASFDREFAERKGQVGEFEDMKKRLMSTQGENRVRFEELEKEIKELTDERAEVETHISDIDRRAKEVQNDTKHKNEQKAFCLHAHSRNENKLNSLRDSQDRLGSSLWDEYELTYEDAVRLNYPPVTKENRAQIAAVQTSCRNKIRALGAVNVAAIDEYREVKERYDFLNVQVQDMNTSYTELSEIVAHIEEEMKNNFLVTFNQINSNFSVVFTELFGGGTAELSLTDPENVLTSGIEIKAAPPGKIIKSLSLLSGGEQAFVAIALFFSILKVNPTPFCILDEIEAALDEVNVFRFGEYVKKFSSETQFVLITHRRGTMEVADRLYGVTMPERGISRVLPLQVSEIESKKKELLGDGVLQ